MKTVYIRPEFEIIEVASYNSILAGSDVQSGQNWDVPGSGTTPVGGSEDDESEHSRAPEFFGGLE